MTTRVASLAVASVDERMLEIVLDDPELFDLEFGTTLLEAQPPVVSTGVADRRWSRDRPLRPSPWTVDDSLRASVWAEWARSPPHPMF